MGLSVITYFIKQGISTMNYNENTDDILSTDFHIYEFVPSEHLTGLQIQQNELLRTVTVALHVINLRD